MKRPTPKRQKRTTKPTAPPPLDTRAGETQVLVPAPLPPLAPIAPGLYITADLGDGCRGYIVLSIGHKWTRLFSPVSLKCHSIDKCKLPALRVTEHASVETSDMLSKLRSRRLKATHYEHFDGGNAADEAEALLSVNKLNTIHD